MVATRRSALRKEPAETETPRKKARKSAKGKVEESTSSTEAISKENEGEKLEHEEIESDPSKKPSPAITATFSRTRFGKGPIVKKAKVWKKMSSPEATITHAGRRSAREELQDLAARLEEIVARFLRTVQDIREEIKRIAEGIASSP